MFQESISAKDNIVMSLTNRLEELKQQLPSNQDAMATHSSSTNTTLTLLGGAREMEKLKVNQLTCTES